jgi:hypothetical protein
MRWRAIHLTLTRGCPAYPSRDMHAGRWVEQAVTSSRSAGSIGMVAYLVGGLTSMERRLVSLIVAQQERKAKRKARI